MTARRWLTVKEGADYFGYKVKTFYSYIRRGEYPPEAILRVGHSIRVNPEIIETELAKRNRKRP